MPTSLTATSAVRNWLVARYLPHRVGSVVHVPWEDFASFLLSINADAQQSLAGCKAAGWVDGPTRVLTCVTNRNHAGRRVQVVSRIGIRPAVLEVHAVATAGPGKRKRGGQPKPAADKRADIKLYRDWKASGLSKPEFVRRRGLPPRDGALSIDRGRKHVSKMSGS